jgi:hypothetical protein
MRNSAGCSPKLVTQIAPNPAAIPRGWRTAMTALARPLPGSTRTTWSLLLAAIHRLPAPKAS